MCCYATRWLDMVQSDLVSAAVPLGPKRAPNVPPATTNPLGNLPEMLRLIFMLTLRAGPWRTTHTKIA